jgi:hypothetical protein
MAVGVGGATVAEGVSVETKAGVIVIVGLAVITGKK